MYSSTEDGVLYTSLQECRSSQSKNLSKLRIILLVIVVGSVLVSTIVLVDSYGAKGNKKKHTQRKKVIPTNNNDICLTPYCVKAAKKLLESIDETVDPCENFYEFTCGTWLKNAKIPSHEMQKSVTTGMQDKMYDAINDLLSSKPPNGTLEPKAVINARRLYNSCIDEDAIEEEGVGVLLSLINTEFGGWPILTGSTWNESTFNYSDLWFKLGQYTSFAFYDIITKMDTENTSIYSIQISPSTLRLIYPTLYIEESGYPDAYRQYMRDIATALASNTSMIEDDVDCIFNLEKDLAEYYRKPEGQPLGRQLRTTVSNLSQIVNTSFDLTNDLRRLYLWGNITLTDDDIVVISGVESLINISSLITQQSPRTLQNYMIWRFIMLYPGHMPKQYRDAFFKFKAATLGIKTEQSRAIVCAEFVNKNMGYAVSKLYRDKYFDKVAQNKSLKIVDNIRKTFIDMVSQSMWMDTISKNMSIAKAEAMLEKVGYPDYLKGNNMTRLENGYVDYKFNSSHLQNVLTVLRAHFKSNTRALRKYIDQRDSFIFPPTTVGAFYFIPVNQIVVPAGILQAPIFHKDAPNYLNYGAFGSMVGHEMSHGFDEFRRQYYKAENISTWSNDTINTLGQRSECITKQYDKYKDTQLNRKVNGIRTLGENIADNDGLKKAYFAYKKWAKLNKKSDKKLPGLTKYSAEQMFFISFGHIWCVKMSPMQAVFQLYFSSHSPSQFRANGPTSNFVEFDQAFRCKPGQRNSRVDKCSVW